MGSSTEYPDWISFSTGILSEDGDNYFANYTRILIKYCDGSAYQGSRAVPILYKGAQIFFRGQDNTLAAFASIN